MKRPLLISAAVLGLLLVGTTRRASAQYPYSGTGAQTYPYYQRSINSYPTPALNPYLNLLRGGNPAANYFMGTLPELDRRAANITFGGAILGIDQRLAQTQELEGLQAPLGQTGHPAYFGNYGSYYTFGVGLRPQGGATTQPSAAAPRRPGRTGQ